MSKKKIGTPRSRIRAALRQLWLRSRERAAVLKLSGYKCTKCGIKQSTAKGREVKVEVHHNPPIADKWEKVIDLIIEVLLNSPQETVCKNCHHKEHNEKTR